MTPEELAAWQARKDNGRAAAKSAEVQIAAAIRDKPELIDGFRAFCARMNPYSIRNCLRIFGQNPEATHVQPRFFWGGYGRAIIDDNAAVWIMAPKVERTKTKEVENPRTGQVEEVEDTYKFWPVEDVYPASATVPKNGPCPFCNGPEGERCPDWCAVMQPQAGSAPSREDVAEALNAVLKQIGGFDPNLLHGLGPDPIDEDDGCPGVTWHNVTITKGAAKDKKPRTRRYRFIHTIDLDRPGVRYAVAGLGVIWIGPHEFRRDTGGDDAVTVQYGDDVPSDWEKPRWAWGDSAYHQAGPHAPNINGITFASYSVVYPSEDRWRWFEPWREGKGRVPETTAEQMGQVVRQLLDHYRGLVELDAIEQAGFRKRSAYRAREAEHEASRLAKREQELAQQRAEAEQRAAAQRALAEQ